MRTSVTTFAAATLAAAAIAPAGQAATEPTVDVLVVSSDLR